MNINTGWHTAGINVLGSFVLGGVFGTPLIDTNALGSTTTTSAKTPAKNGLSGLTPRMKLLLGVGFCGSFTTASTMNVDMANMIGRGEMMKAASYAMANNVGGVCAATAGMMLAKKLFRV